MSAPIKVLVVDDHGVVRDGLAALLQTQPDVTVVGVAATGWEAVEKGERLKPDVVVMDVTLPELNGVEAAERLLKRVPETRIIMLSMHHSSEHVYRALRVGARGYVLKESAGTELVAAVRTVYEGQRFLSPRIKEAVIDRFLSTSSPESPLERLSSREREVLQLTVAGLSSAEIAEKLSLSRKTVETYRGRLMEKLGVADRAALIHFAIQHSLMPP